MCWCISIGVGVICSGTYMYWCAYISVICRCGCAIPTSYMNRTFTVKALKSFPRSKKSPNLVTLLVFKPGTSVLW